MAEARRRRRRQPFAPSSSHAMCPSCWPEASWRRGWRPSAGSRHV